MHSDTFGYIRMLLATNFRQQKFFLKTNILFWKIIETTNNTQYVNGDGVVGKKPIVRPGEIHEYKSGCLITSPIVLSSLSLKEYVWRVSVFNIVGISKYAHK